MKRLTWLGCLTLAIGCSPAVDPGGDTDAASSSSSGSGDGPSTGSIPPPTTAGTTTSPSSTGIDPTVADSTGPGGSSGGSTAGSDSTSFGSSDGGSTEGSGSSGVGSESTTDNPDLVPDGGQCTQDDECLSGHCYVAGALGGVCGECSSDADCDFGCNIPNPLAEPPEGSTCSAGNLGENCESQVACEGALECVEVLDVPGIINVSSCSECNTNGDCDMMEVCNLDLDIAEIDGVWTCVPNGSVPLGETCAAGAPGDAACASGFCAETSIMGLITVNVCSECEGGMGCLAGEVCVEPQVDLDGTIIPGMCV